MTIPQNKLLGLALGFGAWQGRYLKTLDVAEMVDPAVLDSASEALADLGWLVLNAYWNEDDPEFKKDYGRIAHGIHDGLKVVTYG